MLNISNNSILKRFDTSKVKALSRNELPKAHRMVSIWLLSLLLCVIIIFFLPWTQNVQMNGKVTTFLPDQRPQEVNSIIAGKIKKWFVREGELVERGDTIAFLTEIKAEYFDPKLIERTKGQIVAKENTLVSYDGKANALQDQIFALQREQGFNEGQLKNQIEQAEFKIESQQALVSQVQSEAEIAAFQYRRADTLFQKGIKSLSDLEGRRLKMQEFDAKWIAEKNKLQAYQNELNIYKLKLESLEAEYQNKISKVESDRFTTLASLYDTRGEIDKLKNQRDNYQMRNDLYYVIAPQSGYITKTIKSGIGEIIKAGDKIVTIVPLERELAAELYVRPMDLPLISQGQEVRLVFDGWQAFIISGWSDFSFGTFSGDVVAIDNVPNENNLYRILVKSNEEVAEWPDLLRVGAGVKGIAMLKNVPVWYEVWRQLNGFPADFYQNGDTEAKSKMFKAPVKSVAK